MVAAIHRGWKGPVDEYWKILSLGVLFILGGPGLLYAAHRLRQRIKRSHSWPTAQGRVLKSEVTRPPLGTRESATVEYEYTIDGVLYTHDHIELGGNTTASWVGAMKRVAPYPVGSDVTVYFDPEDASAACLERRSGKPLIMTVAGVILWIIGAVFVITRFFSPTS